MPNIITYVLMEIAGEELHVRGVGFLRIQKKEEA